MILLVSDDTPLERSNFNFGLPEEPDFVVIKITPLAPLEPYMAVADASFRIVILSISPWLINDNWLRLQYYQEWMELIVTAYVKDEDMRLLAVKDLVLCYYNKWIDIDDYFKKIV